MAVTIKSKATELYKYRWILIVRGIILFVFGLFGIYLWPIISVAGIQLLGIYVSIIFISEGLTTMAVSYLIRESKYWWVPLMAGSVSLLSAAIILIAGKKSDIVNFVIGGWAIIRAMLSLSEAGIFHNEIKRVWLLYAKNFLLILIVPLVILSFIYGPRFTALSIGYYFFIHGIMLIILCFFGLNGHQSRQSGGSP